MRMRIVLIILCLSLVGLSLPAQSVGIGTDQFKPDASAILELRSDTRGLLIPRLTSDQRTRIDLPSTGLLVYQTDVAPGFFYYNGTQWVAILSLNNLPVDDDQVISFDPVNYMLTLESGGSVDLSILKNGRSLESTVDNGDGTLTFVYNDGTSFVTSDLRGPKGDRGPAGKDANTILTGNSSPAASLGNDGDLYLDTHLQQLYGPKSGTGWGNGTSLLGKTGANGANGTDGKDGINGLDGRTILNGTTDPTATTGNNGDLYINTTTFDFFGPKATGNWGAPISLVGPKGVDGKDGRDGTDGVDGSDGLDGKTILSGNTNPTASTGKDGDIYLNTTLFNFFGPKTSGNWGTPVSLVGPKGADGKDGLNGKDGADGIDGLNGTNGKDGTGLLHATTFPAASLGNEGDFFINTTTAELYGPKSTSGWGTGISLVGPAGANGKDGKDGTDGADGKDGVDGVDGVDGTNGTNGVDGRTILNGSSAPAATIGNEGDLYLDTSSSTLYGPKTTGNWGTGIPLIGVAGSNGKDGADGKDGTDGANGVDGRTILSGNTNPSLSTGSDGDFFLNTGTQMLFGPKTAGKWNTGVSLVGVGIQSTADNPDGSITFNFTDGTSFTSQPDGDFSSSNELISQLKLSGKTLQITENGMTQAIDLSAISSTTQITDSDENTTITVDQNESNDNIIRFIAGGTEALRLNNKTLEFVNNLGSVAIGENAAMNNSGAGNVAIGTEAAFQNTSGRFNLALGYRALRQNTTGEGNIAIGYNAGFNETGSNKLYIDNSNTNAPLIWGDFANDVTNINGKLGIGVASPSSITNELEVNGSAVMISLTETSDKRFKKNINTLSGSLGKLQQLRGVSFDWRTGEFPQKRFRSGSQIGFIAQEVQQVFPQLVSQTSDGYYAVSYSGMTPLLVEALKEQQAQINELQNMINDLKTELTAIKQKIK